VAASAAALLVAAPLLIRDHQPSRQATTLFQTPLCGHDRVALPDGSTVELNTSTVIHAGVSNTTRDVWLDHGEAFFSVRHLQLPFVVHAGSRLVTVLGTKFSVSREGDLVRVSVVQGTVRVSDANATDPNPEATITRGDFLETASGSTLVVQNAEDRIERSLAWREGMLEFEQTPLADAAEQFNRYNQRKLIVTGSAAALPIGGSFRISNVEAFARLLHDAYGLHVEYTPTEMKIST
jgi:transmembrane sensor